MQGRSLPPAPSAYGRELRLACQPCWGWCLGGAFECRLPWCWRIASEGNLVRMVLCLWRLGRGPWWIHFWIGPIEFWLCCWHPCVSVLWILGEPPYVVLVLGSNVVPKGLWIAVLFGCQENFVYVLPVSLPQLLLENLSIFFVDVPVSCLFGSLGLIGHATFSSTLPTKQGTFPWRSLKVIIRLADNMLAYNVLLTFPERNNITSSYSTSIGLWKIISTGPYLISKENIIFDKVVIWWLFANVPRMLGENVLLTRFEYQRFNGTTKVDTIHIVYILVIIRLYLHIPY